jgi:hypothetical protein
MALWGHCGFCRRSELAALVAEPPQEQKGQ